MGALPTCPFDELRQAICPLTAGAGPGDSSSSSSSPPAPPRSVASLIDDVERRVVDASGLPSKPLVCTAAETAVDTAVRAVCDELGSLSVELNASSSSGLLLRGELSSARVEATSVAAAGVRASELSLSSDAIDFVVPDPLSSTPPNLKAPANLQFSVRLSADDINRSPVIFAALQEILRELLSSGVSAAIGEALPRDRSGLVIQLVKVEPPQDGRLVLVADAQATQSDGSVLQLQGMRVRTTPRTSLQTGLLILDSPELVSSFEGFGAKVEVGLPFLRAAGVPLPPDVRLTSLVVSDGAIACRGTVTLRPVDYQSILEAATAAAQDLQNLRDEQRVQQRWEGDAVAVDVEASTDEPPRQPGSGSSKALPGA